MTMLAGATVSVELVFASMEIAPLVLLIMNVHQILVTAVNAFQTRHSSHQPLSVEMEF